MKLGLPNLSPRLKKILNAAGCRMIKLGKGYEIWTSPSGTPPFAVDDRGGLKQDSKLREH